MIAYFISFIFQLLTNLGKKGFVLAQVPGARRFTSVIPRINLESQAISHTQLFANRSECVEDEITWEVLGLMHYAIATFLKCHPV